MKRKNNKRKVFVAMSGGVDSSVAALLLKKSGYDVIGVFMKNWSDASFLKDKKMCPWEEDQKDARKAAAKLGIPFYTFDFEREYKEKVVEYMINGYKNGITPNPDVMCNKEIKFKIFLEKSLALGADFIATGHYARIEKKDQKFYLLAGKDKNKDQSYFLNTLGQHELSHTIFPIGEYEKQKIRKMAEKFGFENAKKKDSQGVCFIGELDVFEFLKSKIPAHNGEIRTKDGKVVGKHQGVEFYTIGQRHGIGSPGGGMAYYVVKKDAKNNILYVAEGENDEDLYKGGFLAKDAHWTLDKPPKFPLKCRARIRYRQPLSECVVNEKEKDVLEVKFLTPQRAVAPGQSAVFYDCDIVLGGAIIQ
ncbi:tRNA 2-thiouridine(34) synthase MnmA [Candidatus Azambacteria bacterium]|nr:tRNA 2-thiouridine(34) synthase MnmA [Candidatus Azambacteria bacterium]